MKCVDVIEQKFEEKDILIWKHPLVNFNSFTKLNLNDSQVAVFKLNGQSLDIIKQPGQHQLDTGKLPLLSGLLFGASKHSDIMHSEVYFINLVNQMSVGWRTISKKIQYVYEGVPFFINANGTFSFRIDEGNPKILLDKLVGTGEVYTSAHFVMDIEKELGNKIAIVLKKLLDDYNVDILNLNSVDFTNEIRPVVEQYLNEYGVILTDFTISSVFTNNNNQNYIKYVESRSKILDATLESRTAVAEHDLQMKIIQQRGEEENLTASIEGNVGYTRAEADAKIDIKRAETSNIISSMNAQTQSDNLVIIAKGQAEANSLLGVPEIVQMNHDTIIKMAESQSHNSGIATQMVGGMGTLPLQFSIGQVLATMMKQMMDQNGILSINNATSGSISKDNGIQIIDENAGINKESMAEIGKNVIDVLRNYPADAVANLFNKVMEEKKDE